MRLFECTSVGYCYPEREFPALFDVSLAIDEGEFVLVVGPSGGGKSTLARLLGGLLPRFYGGSLEGGVHYLGRSLLDYSERELRGQLGMVFQDPETQCVMCEVEYELVFGLENLGLERSAIRRRLEEVICYFALGSLRSRKTRELSSGELQKVVLASVVAMMPKVLILDEPTSQLAPAAAKEFFGLIAQLNRDFGMTIILIEQDLEHCFSLARRVICIERGRVIADDSTADFSKSCDERLSEYLPAVVRFSRDCGLVPAVSSVRELRPVLRSKLSDVERPDLNRDFSLRSPSFADTADASSTVSTEYSRSFSRGELKVSLKAVSYRYPEAPAEKTALNKLSLDFFCGEVVSLIGDNGAGKSTLLKVIAGLIKPAHGSVGVAGRDLRAVKSNGDAFKVGYLGQDPNLYLLHHTVEEELVYTLKNYGMYHPKRVEEILDLLELQAYRNCPPRDLSTGERQRVALGSILVAEPEVILLDEPTRGLDAKLRRSLGELLRKLAVERSVSVVVASQDVEFVAEFSQRVVLLAGGSVLAEGTPNAVLDGNLFYSTEINKLFRGIHPGVIRLEEAKRLIISGDDTDEQRVAVGK